MTDAQMYMALDLVKQANDLNKLLAGAAMKLAQDGNYKDYAEKLAEAQKRAGILNGSITDLGEHL